MDIHELTPGEDGLVGTFCIEEKLSGILVLAGSRKGLASIVEDLESAASSGDEDQSSSTDEAESLTDEEASPRIPPSSLEIEDDRINRRAQAFEKNSFRNPKFWLRWQGRVRDPEAGDEAKDALDSDKGYLIFSSNDCERFEGTISCSRLDWDNVKLQGWKIHSRATPCPLSWAVPDNS
ncbi:hypothetical protein EJ03DRAFT_328418 [Teratosphaeria nubilosa]|uniref:Uncharacterized protein n=1 Tax=Teratosphaeria nubilosa TaxID=161662 RepID=A0A6G1L750_9PEZI|nr:hypothetical protein EJ03DRAFT_328418 [Teratosphaeria nubilosa]